LLLGLAAMNSFSAGFGPSRAHAASASQTTTRLVIDRAHKGDRLDRAASVARKTLESRPAPRLIEACEPVASPYVDPALAQIPGHCFG
jgi:hypothetical protein